MSMRRYNDYYLVNDEDMAFDNDSIEFTPKKKCTLKKLLCISSIVVVILAVVAFIGIFVVFPLAFKYSLTLQQTLVFTRWHLPSNHSYYNNYRFPEYKNHYVTIRDIDNVTKLQLGLWHMLPLGLAETAIYEDSFDYDAALRNSNYSVLLYFHGTGEDRTQSSRKYQLLRYFFHVIAFDYRGYGDSDKGNMLEKSIVNDCVQIYQWLQERTEAPIYFWGHSLGTALATSTLRHLGNEGNVSGLILEAPFTSFREELFNHPYMKYFKWLPWFECTIVEPLETNGFIFDTSHNILGVDSPIMFLHAKDDYIVPYFMSEKLYRISWTRNVSLHVKNSSKLVLFDRNLRLNHYFIYQDPYVIFYIFEFLRNSTQKVEEIFIEGSHQS